MPAKNTDASRSKKKLNIERYSMTDIAAKKTAESVAISRVC